MSLKKINLWESNPPLFDEKYNAANESNIGTPSITPYIINDEKKHPVVLVIPGGGYTHRADHEGEPTALWLNRQGINAFVFNYRVEPYMYPVQLIDVQRAVKFIKFNADKFNIISDKVGVMGFSAGAHIACMLSEYFDEIFYENKDEIDALDARPDICVLCYPVITMNAQFAHEGSVKRLIGEKKELISKLSGEMNVREDMPPVFLWHTAEDKSVPVRNSIEMAMALKQKEVPFELHIFPDGRHGTSIVKCVGIKGTEKWPDILMDWLERMNFALPS